ncbi:MerR family transcriptional regulator [Marinihelvus fidelis]|uniref:MerR family transcriptional regulator n=1 Tax=Marinihelvus fidelis TaxID=2613842 RepID=A0A5N0T9V8_9GAMM|nr:MerR family transcriptional regulator [Marinihelvus fidelis]KAA9131551.1 MerR family transcriptional regulator [Marinihelvus fidelis]
MPKLYDLQEIAKVTGLPERTVRYYLAKVVNAPSGTPGRKSYYDQQTVDRLKLAKQVLARDYDPKRGEVKPSLEQFSDWLDNLDEEEIHRLAEMPYRIKPKAITQPGSAPRRIAMNVAQKAHTEPNLLQVDESASNYLDRIMGPDPHRKPEPPTADHWNEFQFGHDLVIRVRNPLTRDQRRQVELAGALLKSVVGGK